MQTLGEETKKEDKESVRREKTEKYDRISNLPDPILAHILGKLNTKNAVGTAVLSTRWKHLVTEILEPEISIKDSDLLNPKPCSNNGPIFHRRSANFIKFMFHLFNVVLKDVRRIKKFHLTVDTDYEFNESMFSKKTYFYYGNFGYVYRWVLAALRLNVSHLCVLTPVTHGEIPDDLFTSTALVDVMLNWHASMVVPDTICLPNLKNLYMKNVIFYEDDLLKILSGCHVLEELCLCDCEFIETKNVVRIFSPSVKTFKWSFCYQAEEYGLELDMPALLFFYYDDYVTDYFFVKNLKSLRKAYIKTGANFGMLEFFGHVDFGRCLKVAEDIMVGCANVEYLSLHEAAVSAVTFNLPSLCPFYNLIELKFHNLSLSGWKLLPILLKNAPKLEVLVFSKGFHGYSYSFDIFMEYMTEYTSQLPEWLALNFRRLRFEKFYGEVSQCRLVKYFLKTAKALKKIEISFDKTRPETSLKAMAEVEALRTMSSNCCIDLIDEEEDDSDRSFGMREFK